MHPCCVSHQLLLCTSLVCSPYFHAFQILFRGDIGTGYKSASVLHVLVHECNTHLRVRVCEHVPCTFMRACTISIFIAQVLGPYA